MRVPVRMLEHYHFRLAKPGKQQGVGQGAAKPGDVLAPPASQGDDSGKGSAGSGEGGIEFTLEFKIDDIVDWLWEEMQLPNLKARVGKSEDADWTREGWDKRGARSRLDRRRSMRESIKRRAVQTKEGQDEGRHDADPPCCVGDPAGKSADGDVGRHPEARVAQHGEDGGETDGRHRDQGAGHQPVQDGSKENGRRQQHPQTR